MGEEEKLDFEFTFNRSIKVESREELLTGDAGVMLLRELDERLGLTSSLGDSLYDRRKQDQIRYGLTELLRQRIYGYVQGYRHQDDGDRTAHDPAMRLAVWEGGGEHALEERLSSQPTLSRLLNTLAEKGNLEKIRNALSKWTQTFTAAAGKQRKLLHGTLDVDSFEIEVFGRQEGGRYNGHFRRMVYHPLVASLAPEGCYDGPRLGEGFVHAILRSGEVHTAAGALRFMRNAVARAKGLARTVEVRMDAGFTIGRVLDGLSQDGIRFVGRLSSNPVLERLAEPFLKRPVGRPPVEGYEFNVELGMYRAKKWKYAQRLLLVVVDRPDARTGQLSLWPEHFFLVTNWTPEQRGAEELLQHYRKRGTFEDRLAEIRNAVRPSLSSPRFAENEATLLLVLLAHNLLGMVRGLLEGETGSGWDAARVRDTLLKTGGRILKHSRRLILAVGQAVTPLWNLFQRALRRLRVDNPGPKPKRRCSWTPPPAHAHLCLVLRQ
jgi:hypothetical protein